MREYAQRYDWISWPDQDEFLEGGDPWPNLQGLARRGRAVSFRLDPVQ